MVVILMVVLMILLMGILTDILRGSDGCYSDELF